MIGASTSMERFKQLDYFVTRLPCKIINSVWKTDGLQSHQLLHKNNTLRTNGLNEKHARVPTWDAQWVYATPIPFNKRTKLSAGSIYNNNELLLCDCMLKINKKILLNKHYLQSMMINPDLSWGEFSYFYTLYFGGNPNITLKYQYKRGGASEWKIGNPVRAMAGKIHERYLGDISELDDALTTCFKEGFWIEDYIISKLAGSYSCCGVLFWQMIELKYIDGWYRFNNYEVVDLTQIKWQNPSRYQLNGLSKM